MELKSLHSIRRAFGLVVLLVAPALVAYATGYDQIAHYAVLGSVLAFHLGVQVRQLAPFGILIPFVYAAAAVTANFTDGVAALIVAVAAATGAASSLGYHRGLLAVLAAALIGSYEPAAVETVAGRSLALFVGCAYGLLLVQTVGRSLTVRTIAVESRTALSYSMLLAVLVLVAWFLARSTSIQEVWWLPLTVAALGEPWLEGTAGQAVTKLATALGATLLVLTLLEPITEPALRAACAAVLLLALVLTVTDQAWLHGFFFTPVLVLLAADEKNYASVHYIEGTLFVFAAVALFTVLGKWVLWTLRPDSGRAAASG